MNNDALIGFIFILLFLAFFIFIFKWFYSKFPEFTVGSLAIFSIYLFFVVHWLIGVIVFFIAGILANSSDKKISKEVVDFVERNGIVDLTRISEEIKSDNLEKILDNLDSENLLKKIVLQNEILYQSINYKNVAKTTSITLD